MKQRSSSVLNAIAVKRTMKRKKNCLAVLILVLTMVFTMISLCIKILNLSQHDSGLFYNPFMDGRQVSIVSQSKEVSDNNTQFIQDNHDTDNYDDWIQTLLNENNLFYDRQSKNRMNQSFHQKYPNNDEHPSLPSHQQCGFKGKVFILGMQKTGTTALMNALKWMDYYCRGLGCNNWRLFDEFPEYYDYNDSDTSKNTHISDHLRKKKTILIENDHHKRPNQKKKIDPHWYPRDHLLSFLLSFNSNLTDKLLHILDHSQTFNDFPWFYLYPLTRIWYPNSKYVLLTRNNLWSLVNSQMKYAFKQRIKQGKFTFQSKMNDFMNTTEISMAIAQRYERHTQEVLKYFQQRPNLSFLHLTLSDNTDDQNWRHLLEFLECDSELIQQFTDPQNPKPFPHTNQATLEIKDFLPMDLNVSDYDAYFNGKTAMINLNEFVKPADERNPDGTSQWIRWVDLMQ